jgi:hypothetical protein
MAKTDVICDQCKTSYLKDVSEYNRNKKLGRPSYCSRSCSGKANAKSLGEHLGNGNIESIPPEKRFRPKDEYSVFRDTMRRIKRRFHDYDIDLPYLKELWENQEGKCPFTGWDLELKYDELNLKSASLDRIDNSKGYIKGNVRFVSVMYNYCRNNFSDDQVIEFCEAVISKG